MHSDGHPLPDIAEAAVLKRLGLIRSDQLPDIAARWLADDMLDTESTRMLAGHDRHDPWALDKLFADSMVEAGTTEAEDIPTIERIAVAWVFAHIQTEADTRGAVRTLAAIFLANYDLDQLGQFDGLDDEWTGRWGRAPGELAADAREAMKEILDRPVR